MGNGPLGHAVHSKQSQTHLQEEEEQINNLFNRIYSFISAQFVSLFHLQVVKLPAGRQEHSRDDDDQRTRTQVSLRSFELIHSRATVKTTKQDDQCSVSILA